MLVILRAIVMGLAVGLIAANVWPLLLLKLGMPIASVAEIAFLAAYLSWASGGGPPKRWRGARAEAFRVGQLDGRHWLWGIVAALSFAVTVHAAIVVLFRLVPFPAAAFHAGYDFSFIPTLPMRWIAVVVSAASAGICEETGFRGYMQQPIERRYGPFVAILISSTMFMLIHLNKSWSMIGMVPIVFGAGLLLGLLAWASRTLIFCMIGHTIMDIGLFAYWWTQIAGTFPQKPISVSGADPALFLECIVLMTALALTLFAIFRLARTDTIVDSVRAQRAVA
jgi:membrane protease YdiL (CAAX protease family)